MHSLLKDRSPSLHFCLVVIPLLFLAISGCSASRAIMYDGKELEPSKQAVVRGDSEKGKIVIVAVDGSRTINFFAYTAHGWPTEIAVLPGAHDLIALVHFPFSPVKAQLSFIADAGERYIIKARAKGYAIKVWIENERTGEPAEDFSGNDEENQ